MTARRWIARVLCGITLAPLGAAPGVTQVTLPPATPPEGVLVLTLDDALRIAAERNLDVKRAEESRRAYRGRYIEERAAAFPELALDGAYYKNSDETQTALVPEGFGFSFPTESTTQSAVVSLSQPLFTWGQVGAAIRAARVGLASAEDVVRQARQVTVLQVTAAFQDVLLARELSAIARQELEQRERQLNEAQRKMQLGTATDYDVLAADVAVQNVRPRVIRADNSVRNARDRLRFLLALGPSTDVDARGDLAVAPAPVPEYDEALETAFAQRADLAEAEKRRQVYAELVRIARAQNKPRLDLNGSYGWKDWDLGYFAEDGTTWSAGVFLSFPFFDGQRTRGRVMQAVSGFESQDIAVRRLREQVALEVRDALSAVRESTQIADALGGTESEAVRLLAMAEKGFQLGVKTRLEVEDAQLNLAQARYNLARARRDLLVAQTNLEFVTGTLRY